jgi:hypothetical protein
MSYVQVGVGSRTYKLPTAPEALTRRQYARIAGWLRMPGDVQVWTAIATELLADALGWWRRGILRKPGIDPVSMLTLAGHMEALAPEAEEEHLQGLDKAPQEFAAWIPGFWHRGRYYAMPQPNLDDVTYGEWTWISFYMEQIKANPEQAEQHFSSLAAVICRPLRPWWQRRSEYFDGYPRIRLNQATIERRAKRFQSLPFWAKLAAVDYAERAALFLRSAYRDMFTGPAGGSGFGWPGMALSLAEAGTFGPEKEIQHVNIHKICLYAVKRIRDQREMEERLESL